MIGGRERGGTIRIKSKKSQFHIDKTPVLIQDNEQSNQDQNSQRSMVSVEEDEETKKIRTEKLKEALNKKAEMLKRQNKLKAMMKKKPIHFTSGQTIEDDKPTKGLNL